MKKVKAVFLIIPIIFLGSCRREVIPQDFESEKQSTNKSYFIDDIAAKENYNSAITIDPDISVTKSDENIITLCKEKTKYIISGYFEGQIIVKAKNVEIQLNNAFLENPNAEAAIYFEQNGIISSVNDTGNYIISSGSTNGEQKGSAIEGKKDLTIGGGGKIYIKGYARHALKAETVKLKNEGHFYFEASKEGAAINCENFIVDKTENVTAYFYNSKNGIKADKSIKIEAGTYYFYGNKNDIKIDKNKKNIESLISGGKFYTYE